MQVCAWVLRPIGRSVGAVCVDWSPAAAMKCIDALGITTGTSATIPPATSPANQMAAFLGRLWRAAR